MGIGLALLTALSYAAMTIFVRLGGQRGGADNGVLAALFVNVTLHGLVVGTRALAGIPVPWESTGLMWFVFSGILTTLLGRLALYAGIERIGSARAAPIKNLAPFVTVGMALLLLGERLTPLAALGVGLALLCYLLFIVEGSKVGAAASRTMVAVPVATAAAGDGTPDDQAGVTSTKTSGRRYGLPLGALGYAACTLAATFYGIGTIVRKVGVEAMPDPYMGAFLSASAGLTVYLLYLKSRGQLAQALDAVRHERQPHYWLAGVASTVGQLSYFVALSLAAASVVSVVAASDTVITLILAAVFLGRTERLNPWVVAGAIGVFAATGIIAFG